MTYTAEALRQEWESAKLHVFKRVAISDKNFQVLADINNNPKSVDAINAFCDAVPMSVARMPKWITTFMILASTGFKTRKTLYRYSPGPTKPSSILRIFAEEVARHMCDDVRKINSILMPAMGAIHASLVEAGYYTKSRDPKIHTDNPESQHTCAVYLMRAKNLPILISKTGQSIDLGPAPLDELILITAGKNGTPHCSSPARGAWSLFARYFQGPRYD